ncbi:MAG: histidine phosphatase family protein [Pirellulaceae bacterium]|nr:histidine phosphatase family protein [Pirellulaceae bacterium]
MAQPTSFATSEIASSDCYLYLVRHGATDNNLANPPILQGRNMDVPLSEQGREQSRLTADLLANFPLSRFYSSPLQRANETAQIIATPHDQSVETNEELTEVDVGNWEGRDWKEIAKTDSEAYRLFQEDCSEYPYLGGETFLDVQKRVVPTILEIMQSNLGRAILIAGHNVVNRTFMAHVLKMSLAKARTMSQTNCAVNIIRLREGELQAITVNSYFHLGDLKS